MIDSGDELVFLGQPTGTTAGTVLSPNVVDAKGDLIVGTAADTVSRLAVGADNTVLVADAAQPAGAKWTGSLALSALTVGGSAIRGQSYESDSLAAGQFVPSRISANTASATAAASGQLVLAYWTADKTENITTVTAYTGGTAAAATPTLVRYGIYSVDAAGALTLVASTANDTTLLAAAATAYPKALSSTFAKVAGQRYAVGLLIVSGAAMPTMLGRSWSGSLMLPLVAVNPAMSAVITGQTDLPASASAPTTSAAGIPLFRLS